MKLFFSPWITNWVSPQPDAISTSTPLVKLGNFAYQIDDTTPSVFHLFTGIGLGGPIGETCKLVLILAGVYLIYRRIINPFIPFSTLISFYIVILIYSGGDVSYTNAHLFSGALIFAVFLWLQTTQHHH